MTYQDSLIYIFVMKGSTVRNPARAAELFHALADPTRLEILDELKEGECCVCELTDRLQAGQSRLSGMILDRREGRWMYYSVNADALAELDDLVDSLKQAKRARRATGCC